MRLIHTKTLKLHEFIDAASAPEYAILSHRGGNEEISYEAYQDYQRHWYRRKPRGTGYEKIVNCCKLARQRGQEWLWIDTCCIDKRSSAELSEAINSMYSWYEGAKVCYAYLVDVRPSKHHSEGPVGLNVRPAKHHSDGPPGLRRDFANSVWFTRGWTLQELIAPPKILFVSHDWTIFGQKHTRSNSDCAADVDQPILNETISLITGIPQHILLHPYTLESEASVAQRMSWAANRITTRVEDMAYCLLGIFKINMPLLYGEGRKAFPRLQAEIVSRFSDESILAWTPYGAGRMLAVSPADFANCENIGRIKAHNRPPITQTTGMIKIRVSAGPGSSAFRGQDDSGTVRLMLNCGVPNATYGHGLNEVMPYVMTLKQVKCGHYKRILDKWAVRDDDPQKFHWVPFGADEVLYVHLSWADAFACIPDQLQRKDRHGVRMLSRVPTLSTTSLLWRETDASTKQKVEAGISQSPGFEVQATPGLGSGGYRPSNN